MRMSHMAADSDDELDAMADRLGLDRRWKHKGSHYDLCKSKRLLAIKYGAKEVEPLFIARLVHKQMKEKKEIMKPIIDHWKEVE